MLQALHILRFLGRLNLQASQVQKCPVSPSHMHATALAAHACQCRSHGQITKESVCSVQWAESLVVIIFGCPDCRHK